MFTNFKNTFKENNKENLKIPTEIMKVINRELPKDLKYYQFENGMCGIVSKNAEAITIKTQIKIPEIPEEIKKEIHDFNDMYEYLYRTQKSCEVVPDEDGNILINNNKIKIENFVKDVILDQKIKKFQMVPPSFPKPVKMNIQAGNMIKEFSIERQPYESMDTVYLKTVEEKPLCIKFYIKSNNKVDVNININISEIENVDEIVDACEYYKNFMEGKIILGNSKIESFKGNTENSESHIEDKISFWKKVLEIEKYLNKSFNAKKLKDDHYIKILRIYKSIIEKKPFRIKNTMNSLNIENYELYEKIVELKGKNMLIEYNREEEITVFNRKIKVYILERIYNHLIKDVIMQDNKIKIIFGESKEQNSFVAQKYFLSEDDLKKEQLMQKEDHDMYMNAEIL